VLLEIYAPLLVKAFKYLTNFLFSDIIIRHDEPEANQTITAVTYHFLHFPLLSKESSVLCSLLFFSASTQL